MGNFRLSKYSLAGCDLFRSSILIRSFNGFDLKTGVEETIRLTFLMSILGFFWSLNFSILYSLYSDGSSVSISFDTGILTPQLWHLNIRSLLSSKTYPRALFLFLCESPQIGHRKFQVFLLVCLNFWSWEDNRLRYLISTYMKEVSLLTH